MRHIGIIAAMDEEIESIKSLITNIEIKQIYDLQFTKKKGWDSAYGFKSVKQIELWFVCSDHK